MNNWLNENQDQISHYLSNQDIILVDRKKHLTLMLQIFRSYFSVTRGLRFLDIGCGSGILSQVMAASYPENEFTLLDGSRTMLDKAAENMNGFQTNFIHSHFENFFLNHQPENHFDFIYSSMALHHLQHHQKAAVYSSIHCMLKHGGLFLNSDVILPVSQKTESIQFQLWQNEMNQSLKELNYPEPAGTHDKMPEIYKAKPENKPSTLTSQLEMLQAIGYTDVECWHKNGIFCLFGGLRG